MRRYLAILILLGSVVLFVQGCSSSDDGDSVDSAITNDPSNNPPATGDPGGSSDPVTTIGVGELGDLVDLGDLLAPDGDHWYFTRATGINDAGTVIGQSNRGGPVKAAFKWEPATEEMTYLGIHNTGIFEDYYGQFVETIVVDPSAFIYSETVDINESGVIIGNSSTGIGWPHDTETRAFVWKEGAFIDLAPLPGNNKIVENEDGSLTVILDITSYSKVADINNAGQVLLTADDATPFRHAYLWDGTSFTTVTLPREDGTLIEIEVPAYDSVGSIVGAPSEAVAINENGQVVVNSGGTAVFYDINWQVTESLNHLPGATFTAAVDINDSIYTNNDGIIDGHIIGNSGDGFDPADLESAVVETNVQGFFWDGGAMYPVNHLGGGTSVATDINNSDQVVGGATTADGSVHAYLWTLDEDGNGTIRDLGTLGGANSFATAINEAGQVTGWAEIGTDYQEEGVSLPIRHAFLWDDGVMYDLGTHNYFYDYPFVPSYPFSEGVSINASAEVAGNSTTINKHDRGFFLSPIFPGN